MDYSEQLKLYGRILLANRLAALFAIIAAVFFTLWITGRNDSNSVRKQLKETKMELKEVRKNVAKKENVFYSLIAEIRKNDSIYYSENTVIRPIPVDSLIGNFADRFDEAERFNFIGRYDGAGQD